MLSLIFIYLKKIFVVLKLADKFIFFAFLNDFFLLKEQDHGEMIAIIQVYFEKNGRKITHLQILPSLARNCFLC